MPAATPAPPKILWHDVDQHDRKLVEIRASDRTGLLAVLTAVFERAGVDVAWAKITTVGSSVIDVFAISVPGSADSKSEAIASNSPWWRFKKESKLLSKDSKVLEASEPTIKPDLTKF